MTESSSTANTTPAQQDCSKEKGIWLFNHASLAANTEQQFIGQKDVDLTSGGRAACEALAQKFVEGMASQKPEAFFCSDLRSAVTCADILRRAFRPAGGTMPVIADPGFRELNYGAWEGLTREDVEKRYPGALDELAKHPTEYAPAGGESLTMLKSRSLMAVLRARLHTPDGIIVVLGHTEFNRCLLADYLALPLEEADHLPQPWLAHSFLENR